MRSDFSPVVRQVVLCLFVMLCFFIPFSIAAIEILFFSLLVGWLLGWRPWEKSSASIWRSKPARYVLLFLLFYLGACAWTIRWSSFPALSLQGLIRKMFQFVLLFLIAGDVAQDSKTVRRCLWALLTACWIVILYALLQQWVIGHFAASTGSAIDPIRGRPLIYGRMTGPYSNPNDLATFFMADTLIIFGLLTSQETAPHRSLWLLSILLLGCLAWIGSKGALLGLGVGVCVLFFIRPKGKKTWLKIGGLLFFAVLLFLYKRNDLLTSLALSDPASKERTIMWNAAWRMIQHKPLLGHGINTFMANYLTYAASPNQGPAYAHNCFLQIAAETGIVGLALFLAFLLAWLRTVLGALQHSMESSPLLLKPLLTGVATALIAFLVQSIFDTNLYSLRQAVLFWSLSGLSIGLSAQILRSK